MERKNPKSRHLEELAERRVASLACVCRRLDSNTVCWRCVNLRMVKVSAYVTRVPSEPVYLSAADERMTAQNIALEQCAVFNTISQFNEFNFNVACVPRYQHQFHSCATSCVSSCASTKPSRDGSSNSVCSIQGTVGHANCHCTCLHFF